MPCIFNRPIPRSYACSRNDAIGNIAVAMAALGVLGTGRAWPDLVVATGMALLAQSGAWTVSRQALQELRTSSARPRMKRVHAR